METSFSLNWKRSKQPRKQRKFRLNAPLHIAGSFMGCHLSPDLRKKYSRRSLKLRTGDTVKILKGQFKGKTGKIVSINRIKNKVNIENIQQIRKEGTKSFYPITPSNLMITDLDLSDKKRKEKLEGKKNAS